MREIPKLRIGLIGCGSFGESHLAACAGIPFVQVTAVTDLLPERAYQLAGKYKVPRVAKDYRELCALEDVDAVSVVTTEGRHLEPVLAALRMASRFSLKSRWPPGSTMPKQCWLRRGKRVCS